MFLSQFVLRYHDRVHAISILTELYPTLFYPIYNALADLFR